MTKSFLKELRAPARVAGGRGLAWPTTPAFARARRWVVPAPANPRCHT